MLLKLLAEESTKQDTIDHLVKGVQGVIPVRLNISILNERYSLKKDKLFPYGQEVHFGEVVDETIDGVYHPDGIIWYSLRPIAKRFASAKSGECLLILTHSPFVYAKKETDLNTKRVEVGKCPDGSIYYGGELLTDDYGEIIIVGGDNFPSDNNVKVASHEIYHAILPDLVLDEAHCKNHIDNKRCIMYVTEKTTKEAYEEQYLGFCEPCIVQLKNPENFVSHPSYINNNANVLKYFKIF